MSQRHSMSLLHISDLHFGAHDDDKVRAIVDLARESQPSLLCATGDIVDWPWKENFKRARLFFDSLKPLCSGNECIVPGNHDAYFRFFSLCLFKKHLMTPTEFARHIKINALDVCVFGVDSTCLTVHKINNPGKFHNRSHRKLVQGIKDLKDTMGENRYRRAFKICLVHHHPLPTLSSEYEGMLYLKNSGAFLNIVAKEGFDLVLHGHKHEPHFFSVNYNRAAAEPSMVILSAGSGTKKIVRTQDICPHTQVHIVYLYEKPHRSMEIHCYNYDHITKSFWQSRVISRNNPPPVIERRKHHLRYLARASNGNMHVVDKRRVATGVGRRESEFTLQFGVDAASLECNNFADLQLKLRQDSELLPADRYRLLEDEPRRKALRITLPKPIDEYGTWIECEYEWPEGFSNLFRNSKDVGLYLMQLPLEELKVELEIESTDHAITEFRVRYHEPDKVEHLYKNEPKKRGFLIKQPVPTWAVRFEVSV